VRRGANAHAEVCGLRLTDFDDSNPIHVFGNSDRLTTVRPIIVLAVLQTNHLSAATQPVA
jgi:hypothetical protein